MENKDITYQEAWNKIAEFMNNSPEFSFFINPWTSKNGKLIYAKKYTLATLKGNGFTDLFIADKEWDK